jgi:hypothetical protein
VSDSLSNSEKLIDSIKAIREYAFQVIPIQASLQQKPQEVVLSVREQSPDILLVRPTVRTALGNIGNIAVSMAELDIPIILLPVNFDLIMMDSDMVKAHELFVQYLRASGMPYTVIRPAAYFNDMGMFFSFARKGHVLLFGNGMNRFNPIHGADLARVSVDAAEEEGNSEIDVGGPDIYTYDETNLMAFEALRMKPWIIHVPMWVGDIALFVMGLVNKPLKSILSFALSVSRMDNVAPATGTRHLKDFFRELAAKVG